MNLLLEQQAKICNRVSRVVRPLECCLAGGRLQPRGVPRYGVDACKFGRNYLDQEQQSVGTSTTPTFDWNCKVVFAPKWFVLLGLMNVALLALGWCRGGSHDTELTRVNSGEIIWTWNGSLWGRVRHQPSIGTAKHILQPSGSPCWAS